MKAYPIIFSGPMVRALLEGRKTQTRRLITSMWANVKMRHDAGEKILIYVREAWAYVGTLDPGLLVYKADYPNCVPAEYENVSPSIEAAGYRWKPSIHMPRRLSRLTLDVTDTRIQRLQEISEQDAIAEGASARPNCLGYGQHAQGWSMDWSGVGSAVEGSALSEADIALGSARSAFGNFINGLHDKDWHIQNTSSLWESNPEVIALTFRVHHCNVDELSRKPHNP